MFIDKITSPERLEYTSPAESNFLKDTNEIPSSPACPDEQTLVESNYRYTPSGQKLCDGFVKKTGKPCPSAATCGQTKEGIYRWCYFHNEESTKEERLAVQQKGGTNRAQYLRDLNNIKLRSENDILNTLELIALKVMRGELDARSAAQAIAACNSVMKLLEISVSADIRKLQKVVKQSNRA
jgi:hypothetical protein